jgi:diguanylate cyclase (GGDEF)-like protein
MFPAFLDLLLGLAHSEYGFIGDVLVDKDGRRYLKFYALSNLAWNEETSKLYESVRKKGFEFRNMNNLVGLVVNSGKRLISNDPGHDPRGAGFPKGHPQLTSFMGIPVYFGDRLVGMIGLANRSGGFDDSVMEELSPVVAALGQIIVARWDREARKNAEIELQRAAATDALTGIANRRQLELQLSAFVKRAQRYSEPLSLLMLDIDHFKQVNDQYGHDAGDKVLVELVQQILASIRDADLLGRWGGEEFLLILPQTSVEAGQPLAERIRRNVETHAFPNPRTVTISLGLVTLRKDESPESLVQRADAALYQAKGSGRNRVVAG